MPEKPDIKVKLGDGNPEALSDKRAVLFLSILHFLPQLLLDNGFQPYPVCLSGWSIVPYTKGSRVRCLGCGFGPRSGHMGEAAN